MFIRFDMIHERDRRTDGHRMTAIAALMHSIARKKCLTLQVSPHSRGVSENQVKKLIAVPKLCAPKTKLGLSTSIRMTYLSLGYPFND